jgi:hypothetical protein
LPFLSKYLFLFVIILGSVRGHCDMAGITPYAGGHGWTG